MAREPLRLKENGLIDCRWCGTEKTLDEMVKRPSNPLGVEGRCRDCERERVRKFYAANPGRVKEYSDRKRAKPGQREAERRRSADWKRRHPEKVKQHSRARALRRYGITVEDYDRLLAAQGGTCAICHTPPAEGKNLTVDHCHNSGQVRGLLCSPCNVLLGMGRENPQIFASATRYLSHAA